MSRCIGLEAFQRLLADQLSQAERRALDAHVDACLDCQEKLARLLDESETEMSDLDWRQLRPTSPEKTPRAVTDLVRRLKDQLRPFTETTAGAMNETAPRDIIFPDPPTSLGPLGQLE